MKDITIISAEEKEVLLKNTAIIKNMVSRGNIMDIYEANKKLCRIGNAMIELITDKYYVVPRATIKPYSILEIQNEFEGFDNVQQAYDYAIKLPSDWYMK